MTCHTCNYENNSGHRFCGMCGAPLAAAPERVESKQTLSANPNTSVSGPSFLGLADPASETEYRYLLEDEPRSRHWLAYLACALILATGASLAWHWRNEGYPWRALMASRRMLGDSPVASQANTGGVAPAAPSSPPPTQTNETPQSSSPDHVAGETIANPSADEPPGPVESRKSSQAPPSEVSEAVSNERLNRAGRREDRLTAEGQTFLYGTGGQSNCDRARNDLFTAAEHDDPEAQSIVGTMFATGHCVAIDLPVAYRWLSRAQRQDPANARVASMLRIVWNEMPPEQRLVAYRSSQ
jgi:hypothetical protein